MLKCEPLQGGEYVGAFASALQAKDQRIVGSSSSLHQQMDLAGQLSFCPPSELGGQKTICKRKGNFFLLSLKYRSSGVCIHVEDRRE